MVLSSSGERWVRGQSLGGTPLTYLLRGTLGQGGMATVYRAWDPQLKRDVALTVLDGELNEVRRARFEREGQAAAALKHPNVIGIFQAGVIEGRPCLAYELVSDARPLDQAWETLDLPARLDLIASVADALAQAHRMGVVHRDLKPDNVLVDASGHARVTDFGLAWVGSEERLTRTGAFMGTPQTMSPEQIAGDKTQRGPATDVWALGILLYLALTDEWPFNAPTATELMARILRTKPEPPRALRSAVSKEIERVCLRALSLELERRYPDAAAFGEALAAARLAPAAGLRLAPVAGVLLLGLALGVVGFVGLGRPEALSPEPTPTQTREAASSPAVAEASPPEVSAPEDDRQFGFSEGNDYRIPAGSSLALIANRRELWISTGRARVLHVERGPAGQLGDSTGVDLPGVVHRVARGSQEALVLCGSGGSGRGGLSVIALNEKKPVLLWRDPKLVVGSPHFVAWRDAQGRRGFAIASQRKVHWVRLGPDGKVEDRRLLDWPRAKVSGLGLLPRSGRLLVAGRPDLLFGLAYYDLATGDKLEQLTVYAMPSHPVEGPDGALIVGARSGHVTRYPRRGGYSFLFDPKQGSLLPAHPSAITSMEISESGILFSASRQGARSDLCVWDAKTSQLLGRFSLKEPVQELCWDPALQGLWVGVPGRLRLLRRQP